MRNKTSKGLALLMALFGLVAGVSFALGQQEPPPEKTGSAAQEESAAKPPDEVQPPAAKPPAEEAAKSDDETQDPKAPKRFVPTQRTSADNNATFPVDI